MRTTKISIICALLVVVITSAIFYYNQNTEIKTINEPTKVESNNNLKDSNEESDMDFSFDGLMSLFTMHKYKDLKSYQNHCGGNMNGNSNSLKIKIINEETIVTISNSNWYFEPPKISEYIVDSNILKEIEDIFNKYHMNRWDNKKFTDMFVNDGETCSYNFSFKDNNSIRFASQIFPTKYQTKLKEIDDVIAAHLKTGTKLPGLVHLELSLDNALDLYRNNSTGTKDLIIYSYGQNELGIILKNGTKEKIQLPLESKIKLIQGDKLEFESIESNKYEKTINAESKIEKTIKLDHHLRAGIYKLEYDSFSSTFEIK